MRGVSQGFWSPFLDLGARSAIFWQLKTGTFGHPNAHPPNALACQMDQERGSHDLSAKGARTKLRGPKGLQLEVEVRRAPRLLVYQ